MDMPTPRRAHSLAEMGAIQGRLMTPDEVQGAVRDFRPRPTDVIISPFGKSGTTWLQQTFHTLRTGGDMDFDDISRVVPWIETSRVLGLDLDAPQKAEPRGFKSHLPYDMVPKGARYMVSLRDPKDVLVSIYRFMEGWFMEPEAIPMEAFAQSWLGPPRPGVDYWRHLTTWWEQRDNPDVLLVSYEHMLDDPEGSVRRVAAFVGVSLNDALLAKTLEYTSLPFMLRYKDRFDDALMREASEARCNLPPGSDSAKVRKGKAGEHRTELSDAVCAGLDAIWAERVAPATGFSSYAALEAELRRRNAS